MTVSIYDKRIVNKAKPIVTLLWPFTADAAGEASEESETINGRFSRMTTNPDNVDTPIAGWDLTIEDENGVDILSGNGANRDAGGTGASEQIIPCPHDLAVASKLTFKVANAGDTKKGVVKLYIK